MMFQTYRNRPRELDDMRRQKTMSQRKEQDKNYSKTPKEMEISNMPDREFKVMIIKILDVGKEWRTSVRPSTKR